MTRPVKGFLSKRGRFFDKKEDAMICDAIEDFNEGLTDYLAQYYMPPLVSEFIMTHMRYFLVANREIAEPYIKLVTEMPEPTPVEPPTGPVTVPFDDSNLGDYHPPFEMPDDVNDFLPEPEDETPPVNDSDTFTSAFLDPEGGESGNTEGYEDVRSTGVPGEDATE